MRRIESSVWQLWFAVLACIALAAVVVLLLRPSSPAQDLAERLAGERWYVVALRHTPIGHYRTRNGRTAAGDFEFRTELRFKLGADDATYIEDRLVFDRRAPHRLLMAQSVKRSRDAQTEIRMGGGYAETVVDGEQRRVAVNTDLELDEYLAVEHWLARAAEADAHPVADAGTTMNARTIDFDGLQVVSQRWRIANAGESGIEIAKDDGSRQTRVLLDGDQAPLRMEIGDVFLLQRVTDEAAARIWERSEPLFAAQNLQVPVDAPIVDVPALQKLVLAVDRTHAGVAWLGTENPALLTAEADSRTPVSREEIPRARAASVSHPADDARFLTLAQSAVSGLADQHAQADALTLFIHGYLRYQDSTQPRTVYDTLRERRGDCTEFADLYTTLARAIGLPARTVVGLVYRADAQAFAPHAWNEVAIDEEWRGVDPTWGQTRLSATHLRLPDDWAVAALAELPHVKFRVVAAQY